MFYGKVKGHDGTKRVCSQMLQGVFECTEGERTLAVLYLQLTLEPKKLPIPFGYFDWIEALLNPNKWVTLKRVNLSEGQVDLES